MTACANKNEGKALSGKKAVSATLAGVLAVGMVPAAALANPAEEGAEDADIDLLVVSPIFDVTSVKGNDGKDYKAATDGTFDLEFLGGPNYVKAVTFKTPDGESHTVTKGDADWTFTYKSGGSTVNENSISAIGGYVLEVKYIGANAAWENETITVNFDIVANAAKVDASVQMISSTTTASEEVTVDDAIMFNGAEFGKAIFDKDLSDGATAGKLALVIDGEPVGFTSAKTYKASDTSAQLTSGYVYAGDYITVFTYGNGETVSVPFTVAPFDIAKATITADATQTAPSSNPIVDIAGSAYDGLLATLIDVQYNPAKNGGVVTPTKYGEYTLTVTTAGIVNNDDSLKASLYGTQDVKIAFVSDKVNITFPNIQSEYEVGSGTTFSKTTNVNYDDLAAAKLGVVKVYNAAGQEVSDWWSTPGTYTVVAEIVDDTYTYGGKATTTFKTTLGEIDADAEIFVYYDGLLTNEITKTYDGEDAIDSIAVKVTAGDKTLVEGTDYELVYTNAAGKEVDSIVDANKSSEHYTLTVKPLTFSYTNSNTVNITVNPIVVNHLRVADKITVNGKTGLPYTGSAITPVIEYTTVTTMESAKESDWKVLPADEYALGYTYSETIDDETEANFEKVDKMLEAGAYKVSVYLDADCVNYTLRSGLTRTSVNVIDAKRFLDVPADAWFAPYVDKAATLKYIAGYSNGRFFGPNDSITRGDVCVVLARMANVKLWIDENAGSETKYFETPFADVDGNLYYAEAIAWAAKVGIAKGYGDGTNFEPNSTISRQEFATMLARYAALAGDDTAADVAGELAKYVDGSAVADWAQGAIAWASEEGIMQGYGDTGVLAPELNVSRAEVAKMAVVYQPETPEGVVIDPDANN